MNSDTLPHFIHTQKAIQLNNGKCGYIHFYNRLHFTIVTLKEYKAKYFCKPVVLLINNFAPPRSNLDKGILQLSYLGFENYRNIPTFIKQKRVCEMHSNIISVVSFIRKTNTLICYKKSFCITSCIGSCYAIYIIL